MYLKFDRIYVSGPKAKTDLHAGGIFFCIPYEETMLFSEDGTVVLKARIIERFRPMDGQDIEKISHFNQIGSYKLSNKSYLECIFGNQIFVGLPLTENPDMIAFHWYDKENGRSGGKIFKLSE